MALVNKHQSTNSKDNQDKLKNPFITSANINDGSEKFESIVSASKRSNS